MAIDTYEKRLSMLDFGPPIQPGIPVPSGSFDAGDRAHFLWLYSGFGTVPPPPAGGDQPPSGYIVYCGRMMNRRGG